MLLIKIKSIRNLPRSFGDLNKLLQKELFDILNTERQTFTVTPKFTLN